MIKLSTLTPQSVADEVLGWLRNHVGNLLFVAGNPDHYAVELPGGSLRYETLALTHYAQTGELPDGDTSAAGYLQTVVEALYAAAHPDVYPRVEGEWQRTGSDPEHAIDCVLRAALARDTIARGQPVPLGRLCALVELPVNTLRRYAHRGEISATDGAMDAAQAREWLSGRGVAGYRS